MKSVFISYNQAYGEEIVEILESFDQRGFTRWDEIQGRGSVDGEPHLGNHAWPTLNVAIMTVIEDGKVEGLLQALKDKNAEAPELGLRAFVWNVEQSI